MAKFAYLDESGISVNERVLVVAGVVIDLDLQWRRVDERLRELVREYVPAPHVKSFIFHATKLFHKSSVIPAERSHEALISLLKIPAEFKLGLVFGFIRKPPPAETVSASQKEKRDAARKSAALYHSIAFSTCSIGVERFMNEDTPENEVATLVVENNTDTKQDVEAAYEALTERNVESDQAKRTWLFIAKKHRELLPIRRIIDIPHFVPKNGASILQLADACAMIIRFCLEKRADAQAFIVALSLGRPEKIHVNGLFLHEHHPVGYNIIGFGPQNGLQSDGMPRIVLPQ